MNAKQFADARLKAFREFEAYRATLPVVRAGDFKVKPWRLADCELDQPQTERG